MPSLVSSKNHGKNLYVLSYAGHDVGQCHLVQQSGAEKWAWSIWVWVELRGATELLQTGGVADDLNGAKEQLTETFNKMLESEAFNFRRAVIPRRRPRKKTMKGP